MMRKIFNAHHTTDCEIFFLETAKIPIRFVISKRRLLYLWHILHRDESELVRKVYEVQKIKMTKGDWFEMIQNEKKKCNITLSDEEIVNTSKFKFKHLVEKKVNTYAFEYLKEKASVHSKSFKILEEVKFKSRMTRKLYFKENTLTKVDAQLLFKLCSKMLDVKSNFRNMYIGDLTCRTCSDNNVEENEEHLLICKSLKCEVGNTIVKFDFVFQNLDKQIIALNVFKAVLKKREVLLNYQERMNPKE